MQAPTAPGDDGRRSARTHAGIAARREGEQLTSRISAGAARPRAALSERQCAARSQREAVGAGARIRRGRCFAVGRDNVWVHCASRPAAHVRERDVGRAQAGLRARQSWPPAFPPCRAPVERNGSGTWGGPHWLTVAGAAAGWRERRLRGTAFPFHPPRRIRGGHLLRKHSNARHAEPLRIADSRDDAAASRHAAS